jgi:CBS domain-containing protein
MAQNIRGIMTPNPICMPATAPLSDASRIMRDSDIGAVVVLNSTQIHGIVTDRDIVVRALASGLEPSRTMLGDICTQGVATLSPADTVESAILSMRDNVVRRIPVIVDNLPVGIVSLGDLAVERDRHSVLGIVSAAPPSR